MSITVSKELGSTIVTSISGFKLYEDMEKFALQRSSNKGNPFSALGRVLLAKSGQLLLPEQGE